MPWYEHDHLICVLLGTSFAIVCSVLVALLLRLARRYVLRSTQPIPKPATLPLSVLHTAATVYWIVLLVGLAFVINKVADNDFPGPTSAWDDYFLIGDILFVVAVVLSLLTVISAVRVWRRPATRSWNVIGPIHRY